MQVTTMVKGDITLDDGWEVSELGNAERLISAARGTIHYVDNWLTWIVYRDGRWEIDGGGVGLQRVAAMVPQGIFNHAHKNLKPHDDVFDKVKNKERLTDDEQVAMATWDLHIGWARKSNTEPQMKRMVTLARHLDGIRINSDELDAHPWLFNMRNGTFNFKTKELQAHDPGDLLTMQAPVTYDPTATCTLWQANLDTWQPDRSIQRFLQEITGSGLTGEAVQQLFINTGKGRNGKGTYYKTIQHILGPYASTAPEDMLIQTRYKTHDEEKARLRGCRFLLAPETGIHDALDEAGIKNLTGGDMLHARHLYGKPFDFMPTHTVFLHTNNEPRVTETNAAIWNRVIEIDWCHYIKEEDRDTAMDKKLEAEHSGILNWLIAGTLRWMDKGLNKPPAIVQKTEEYRAGQDTIERFITDSKEAMVADACQLGPVDYIPASLVRKHFEMWCVEENIKPWSTVAVARELRNKGWTNGVKRIGNATAKVWWTTNQVTGEHESPALNPFVTLLPVTSFITHKEESEIEKKKSKEVKGKVRKQGHTVTDDQSPELTMEEQEEEHRAWLRTYGYPVPPTQEEIEQWGLDQFEDPEEESQS